jgi:hypothetical protein
VLHAVAVPNSTCPQKLYVKDVLSLPGPPVYRSIPHGFIYTGYLLCLTESILPLPRALSVSVCVSPSLPSHTRVICPSHARHSPISFLSACNVREARSPGHRLTTFIGPSPYAARIAHCPPAGLIPRYRLDEFMSEVISIFPCSKPLSGGSQAYCLVLESHLFSFYFPIFNLLLAR